MFYHYTRIERWSSLILVYGCVSTEVPTMSGCQIVNFVECCLFMCLLPWPCSESGKRGRQKRWIIKGRSKRHKEKKGEHDRKKYTQKMRKRDSRGTITVLKESIIIIEKMTSEMEQGPLLYSTQSKIKHQHHPLGYYELWTPGHY